MNLRSEHPLKKRKIILEVLTVIGTIVTIYAFFFSVYIDAFRHTWDWVGLPYKNIVKMDLNNSLNLEELRGETKSSLREGKKELDKSIYIFVLDTSLSTDKLIDKPQWYDSAVRFLKSKSKYFREEENKTNSICLKKDKIFGPEAAKVLLFKMLIDLNSPNYEVNDQFAIWTVGNYGDLIYPDPKDPQEADGQLLFNLNSSTIYRAFTKVCPTFIPKDQNTDFEDLFDKIIENYKKEMLSNPEGTPLVLTIISDFLHDVQKKNYGSAELIEQNWNKLENKIQELGGEKVMVNLIALTNDGKLMESRYLKSRYLKFQQLFSIFENNMHSYLFKKTPIEEDFHHYMLFPRIYTEKSLDFQYQNSARTTSYVELTTSKDTKVAIIPLKKNEIFNIMDIQWSIVESDNNETIRDKGVFPMSHPLRKEIRRNQRLRFSYSGKPFLEDVPLWINCETNRKSYLISMCFVKKIPILIAFLMISLQFLFIGYFFKLFSEVRKNFARKKEGCDEKEFSTIHYPVVNRSSNTVDVSEDTTQIETFQSAKFKDRVNKNPFGRKFGDKDYMLDKEVDPTQMEETEYMKAMKRKITGKWECDNETWDFDIDKTVLKWKKSVIIQPTCEGKSFEHRFKGSYQILEGNIIKIEFENNHNPVIMKLKDDILLLKKEGKKFKKICQE